MAIWLVGCFRPIRLITLILLSLTVPVAGGMIFTGIAAVGEVAIMEAALSVAVALPRRRKADQVISPGAGAVFQLKI